MKENSNINSANADEYSIDKEPATDLPVEHYCIFYNELFTIINGITQLGSIKLLSYICSHLTVQNKGTVYLTVGFKAQAADALGCDERTITRAITNLKKHNIIIALPDSERSKLYQINPLLIWKGDQQSRLATISELGLKMKTTPKSVPKKKTKGSKVKRFEVDFDLSIEERKDAAKVIVKALQQKYNYSDEFCKKFYKFYTIEAGETKDGHKLLLFEEDALKSNREFQWDWKIQDWNRRERPEKLSKEEERRRKAEEQDRELRRPKKVIDKNKLFS